MSETVFSHNSWFVLESIHDQKGTLKQTFRTIGTGKVRTRQIQSKRTRSATRSEHHFHAKSLRPFIVVIMTTATGGYSWLDGSISLSKIENHRFTVSQKFADGKMIGSAGGAMSYLLDTDGTPLSDGYHEIKPSSQGGFSACFGAEQFSLDSQGKVIMKLAQ